MDNAPAPLGNESNNVPNPPVQPVASNSPVPTPTGYPIIKKRSSITIFLLLGGSLLALMASFFLFSRAAFIGVVLALEAIKRSVVLPKFTPGIVLGLLFTILNIAIPLYVVVFL